LIIDIKLDNGRFDDYLSMKLNRREVCLYEGEATSRSANYPDITGGREDKGRDHYSGYG
jgi:hypothetical protein